MPRNQTSPTTDAAAPTARQEITTAALRLIGEAEAGELLRALTPERLARSSGRSASTVRYHFGGDDGRGSGTFAFQRRDLVLAVLAAATDGRVDASQATTSAYLAAVEGLRDDPDLGAALAALAEGLLPFTPGPSGPDASARDRVHHLGLAICDTDAAAARTLREGRARQMAVLLPVFRAAIGATGRAIAPGRSVEQLGDAIFSLLDGHVQRLRHDPGAPIEGVVVAVAGIFAAFTRVPGGPAPDPIGEILGTPGAG